MLINDGVQRGVVDHPFLLNICLEATYKAWEKANKPETYYIRKQKCINRYRPTALFANHQGVGENLVQTARVNSK
jgi:hypothetical protein